MLFTLRLKKFPHVVRSLWNMTDGPIRVKKSSQIGVKFKDYEAKSNYELAYQCPHREEIQMI